jgi:prepilin-type N-terminal cleavage/methylation domain-containing protein
MKSYKHKYGVTLVEMLIVVAIIALLTTMVIGIAARIDNQSKERALKNTFALLESALDQFHDYEYNYPPPYSDFDFPLDCNDYSFSNPPNFDVRTTLINALGAANVSITSGTHNPAYSGSEVLYFFLNRVPESRKTLGKIDSSLITNRDSNKQDLNITIAFPDGSSKGYPLLRIIDPWGTTLRYDYYNEVTLDLDSKRTFPVITSAGPDRDFNTPDDITSR